jgi:hypothetical protein
MIYWTSRPLQQKLEFITVWKLYFWYLRSIVFLSMPHCCIKRQYLDIKSKFSSCVIEKVVKANIFLFRTLWFIELQGPLQQKLEFITVWKLYFWNLRSIVFLSMPHCCIKRQYLDIKSKFSSCVIEKVVKANIFLFRTLWFIELQGPLQQKLEFITVWKLYFWNLRSIDFLSMPHCCIKRQFLDIKSMFFQLCDRKGRES